MSRSERGIHRCWMVLKLMRMESAMMEREMMTVGNEKKLLVFLRAKE